LQIENLRPDLVFENRLNALLTGAPELGRMETGDFVESVAATNPIPAGGSVAALAGALAAALGKMVIGFSVNRKRFEAHQAKLEQHLRYLGESLRELRQAVDGDAQAYSQVLAAQQLPKNTETEKQFRELKLQEALCNATSVPMAVAERAYRV